MTRITVLIIFLFCVGCSAPAGRSTIVPYPVLTAPGKSSFSKTASSNTRPGEIVVTDPQLDPQSTASDDSHSTTTDQTDTQSAPESKTIEVDPQWQEPELLYGCEVTSLSMLLDAAGHPVDKLVLADQVPKDTTSEVKDEDGTIVSWGDPDRGFVGDITGVDDGYGVNHGPIVKLMNQFLPGRALDLTGSSFNKLLDQVSSGKPVVVWTTVDFSPSAVWVSWQSPSGPVHITFNEHAVLLVGSDDQEVFVNDPLDNTAAKAVDREEFTQSWEQLGQQAVSYK